jgi:hypothetical protein
MTEGLSIYGAAFVWSLGFSFSRAYVILATIHDIASSGKDGQRRTILRSATGKENDP